MLASLKSVILPGGKTSLDSDGQLVEKEADMVDRVNGSRGTAGKVGREDPQHEEGADDSFFVLITVAVELFLAVTVTE